LTESHTQKIPLSILDLAIVRHDQSVAQALGESVTLAQHAERLGCFQRIWFAEHHNMPAIASAATAVVLAHVAAATTTITLGSGGIMLPNHSPLIIAEQFGTLAELHPGRIELGLGRAPGTDQPTVRAMRRDPAAADRFPQDVRELQDYLAGASSVPGVIAFPGAGTNVPIYILGSSLFGASLAAAYGLPYGFASHFSPDALQQAVALYRQRFQPSAQLAEPYVIAGVNMVLCDTTERAQTMFDRQVRSRISRMVSRGQTLTEEQLDQVVHSPAGRQIASMLTYSAVGDQPAVFDYLRSFKAHADADELMVTNMADSLEDRLNALDSLAPLAA